MDELELASRKTQRFTIKGEFIAKCVSVYDGDTIQAVFKYNDKLQRFSCRMAGYNTAEMRSLDPSEVIAANNAKKALAELVLDKIVYLTAHGFDKYGRLLVDIRLDCSSDSSDSNHNIRDYMITAGYGKPYDGTGEKKW
jgi:endonuclease YncB( thermonuclease family)